MNRRFHFLLYLQASGGLESSGGLQLSHREFYDGDRNSKSENKSTFRRSLLMVIFPDNYFHICSAIIALFSFNRKLFLFFNPNLETDDGNCSSDRCPLLVAHREASSLLLLSSWCIGFLLSFRNIWTRLEFCSSRNAVDNTDCRNPSLFKKNKKTSIFSRVTTWKKH